LWTKAILRRRCDAFTIKSTYKRTIIGLQKKPEARIEMLYGDRTSVDWGVKLIPVS